MAWLYLIIAGLLEVQWAVTMKYTEGFSKLWPSVFCVLGMAASVYFLALAQKTLPLGTSYAIWTGIGALGTVLVGIFYFHEPVTFLRIFFIFTLFSSIVGLKIVS